MKRTAVDEKVIKCIKNAMITKSIHDREGRPIPPKSIIGKNIIIPDDFRSNEDMQEDKNYRELRDDRYNNLETVFKVWFPVLDEFEETIVKIKSIPSVTFKDVSLYLVEKGISKRHLSERYLSYIFIKGIKKIAERFF